VSYSVPLVGQTPESNSLLTRYQGYVRARGGFVEINCPGLYDGPPLAWDKAQKLALNGVRDCLLARKQGTYVTLRVPGQPERRGPAEQVKHFFEKVLRAAREAQSLAAQEAKIIASLRG
jgi:hypothetical protein